MRTSVLLLLATATVACSATPSEPREPTDIESPSVAADDSEAGTANDGAETAESDRQPPRSHAIADAGPGSAADADLTGPNDDENEVDDAGIDDGYESDPVAEGQALQTLPPHPLADLSTQEVAARFANDPSSLGPISLGKIHGGALMNGVQMPEGEGWIIRQKNASWGTQETVDAIAHCINKVRAEHADTPALYIGHLSRKRGGRFRPHLSHQNGRDVDIGYYYKGGQPWYTRANAKNLDRVRTWALVRTFITDTDVELILIDRSLQRLLREYAEGIGEDEHWLDQIFGGKTATLRPMIRHARGHATHIHLRFYSPVARETARRMYDHFIRHKIIRPPSYFTYHRVRRGQTLGKLAKRFGTTARAIRRANRLRSNMIREGRTYKIPRTGGVAPAPRPITVPARRLPPTKE